MRLELQTTFIEFVEPFRIVICKRDVRGLVGVTAVQRQLARTRTRWRMILNGHY